MKDLRQREFFSGWRDLGKFFAQYWSAYGGWASLRKSPYLHLTILFTALTWPLWSRPGWWDVVFAIIPPILGFTVGGFAIVLALGAGDFGAALSSANKPDKDVLESGLAKLSAAFCHFIVIQFTAILMAILARGFGKVPAPLCATWLGEPLIQCLFWGASFVWSVYSLTLTISTAHWIFTSIKLLILYQKLEGKKKAALRKRENDISEGPEQRRVT